MADTETKDHKSHAAPFIRGDWSKSTYMENPHIDNLMSVVVNLGSEFWTMKRRLLVLEKLLDESQVVDRETVEAYMPNEMERERWAKERDDFIDRTFSVLMRETSENRGAISLDR